MEDKSRKYTFDNDNENNEIAEYRQKDLRNTGRSERSKPQAKTKTKVKDKPSGQRQVQLKKGRGSKKPPIVAFYEKNKMTVLWGALGILIIILIIALILTNTGGKGTDKEQNSVEPESTVADTGTEEPATEESETDETGTAVNEFLAEPTDSEYNVLFEKFFQNSYVEWNESALSECYESMQNVTDTNYVYLNKYIESVHDIVCYIGYETEDGKKLVYVTYNIKFQNIETMMPMMEAYMLVNSEKGYRIHNFEVGEELDLYTSQIQENPNYLALRSNINEQLGKALESDEDLKNVYNAFRDIGSESEGVG